MEEMKEEPLSVVGRSAPRQKRQLNLLERTLSYLSGGRLANRKLSDKLVFLIIQRQAANLRNTKRSMPK
jgi:hypothetical protein